MTTAILNRTLQLTEAGHDCRIVFYDYDPLLLLTAQSHITSGRLHPKVRLLSPYLDLKNANTIDPGAPPPLGAQEVEEKGSVVQDDELTSRHYVRYFSPEGIYLKNKNWDPVTGSLSHIDYFNADKEMCRREEYDENGYLHRETGFVRGRKNRERYFTVDSFCYLARWYDADDGKALSIYVFERGMSRVIRYDSVWAWRLEWLQACISAVDGKVVLLADGTNVPPQLLKLRTSNVAKAVVLHTNHMDSAGNLRGRYEPYFSRLNQFDALVALTRKQGDEIERRFDIEGRVWVIPNSIRIPRQPDSIREDQRAVIVARLTSGKGVDEAVQAFRYVVERLPTARLDIFGEGVAADKGRVVRSIQEQIKTLGLEENVTLRGYTRDPIGELAKAGASILSSHSEGLPYTVAESMSVETPVVAYDCRYGPSDFITDGVDGLLVPEGDIDALARSILELLSDRKKARKMGGKARRKIRHQYSPEKTGQKWQEFLGVMLEAHQQERKRA